MRVLGIDFGQARIGFALSDPLKIFASGLENYKRKKNLDEDIQHILDIIKQNDVDTIVFGYPLNMDGTKGVKCQETQEFAQLLSQKTDTKIEFQDERLTTVSAHKMLIDSGYKTKDRRQVVDEVASCIILQAYLDKK